VTHVLFFFDYKPFIAIIGDIKSSKEIENRSSVQKHLQKVLDAINNTYQAEIASNFMITLGDEFQGLLKSGAPVTHIIETIEREMSPITLRFALGVGDITTDIQSAMPLGADGPAYYLARDAISHLKSTEKKKMEPKNNIEIRIKQHEELSALLNAIFSLLFVIKESWTARQAEIIHTYLQGDGTQAGTAKALGIHQPNVQQALAAADFYAYRDALKTIDNILSEIKEADDV